MKIISGFIPNLKEHLNILNKPSIRIRTKTLNMKRTTTLLLILIFYNQAFSQSVIIADTAFKLPILGEQLLYYGFAAGDQVVVSFQEENGKELKEIEIVQWPATSKFKQSKISSLQNKTLAIAATGVYQFRFANTVMLQKNCKLKIERIPADVSRNFNSTVYWHTVYDTIYRNLKPQAAPESYKTVAVIPPTVYYLQANTPDANPRISVPVQLPDFTSEWYYTYTTTTDKKKAETLKSSLQLSETLKQKIIQAGGTSFTADSISAPEGSDSCRIYLLDQSNRQMFDDHANFRHFKEGTRENKTFGVVKIKIANFPNSYLGIRNLNPNSGIYVALEVVAIIPPEEQDQVAETQSVSVRAKNEPYLKN